LVDKLGSALEGVNVSVVTDYALETISRVSGGFRLWSKEGMAFEGAGLLLATGGERNHGLTLARELGEEVAPVYPAYLRLRLASPKLGEQRGPLERQVKLRCEKTGEMSSGMVILSARGLEGPALSALSAKAGAVWHQLSCRIKLTVDWLPETSGSVVRSELHSRSLRGGRRAVGETPLFDFNGKQWMTFLSAARLDPATPWARIKEKKLQALVQRLKGEQIGFNGMGLPSGERAWAGGVHPSGLDVTTGQSLANPGLYFAGEILDLLGQPEGTHVNLAWATAYVAGSSMGLAVA
jgi:predicted Rossmann fold flavoprotein